MTVTAQTLRLTDALRAVVDSHIDVATRDLVHAWVEAWNTIAPEWSVAVDNVVENAGPGRWPNSRQILDLDRVGAALDAATTELERLARLTGVRVVRTAETVTAQATQWESRIIASQLPPTAPTVSLLDSQLPASVLSTIVERTTQQIESRRAPLAHDAATAMRRSLIRGVALGHNPRATAAHMLRTSERHFNGGLSRALNIARTETLDAQRAASAAYQLQHRDVLRGWVWTSKLDARTCPSCWARHGTIHPLTEPGPHDHQQGRCARTPVTKSWAELGIGIAEPPSVLPDAETRFRRLPRDRQLAIMGPTRLAALDDGTLAWGDLSVNRTNPGWRDSWVPVTVRQTRQLAARAS
jgi:SPP1 gp7 family putative phage head morphogenesis protein